jgi:hypothetical protein
MNGLDLSPPYLRKANPTDGGSTPKKDHYQQQHRGSYTPEEEHQLAIKFLTKAEKLLTAVDEAYIITHRNHFSRPLPRFHRNEITIGSELGYGGFGIVYEIQQLHKATTSHSTNENNKTNNFDLSTITESLRDRLEKDRKETQEDGSESRRHDNVPNQIQVTGDESNVIKTKKNYNDNDDDDDNSTNKKDIHHDRYDNNIHAIPADIKKSTESCMSQDYYIQDDNDHIHYTIDKAKTYMRKHTIRNGTSRYVMKQLKENLSELEIARGMVDLAMEAKFLAVIFHPNISKSLIVIVF